MAKTINTSFYSHWAGYYYPNGGTPTPPEEFVSGTPAPLEAVLTEGAEFLEDTFVVDNP